MEYWRKEEESEERRKGKVREIHKKGERTKWGGVAAMEGWRRK